MNTITPENSAPHLPRTGWLESSRRLSRSFTRSWLILLALVALASTVRANYILGVKDCNCSTITFQLSRFPQGPLVAKYGGVFLAGIYNYTNQTYTALRPPGVSPGSHVLSIWKNNVLLAVTNASLCVCLPCDCPAGPPGRAGTNGVNGTRGTSGINGTNGVNGINGTNAPAGSGSSQYGYVYNLSAQVVPLETAVTFSDNGIGTAGITHAPGSAEIVILNKGDYKIGFSVSGTEPNQFALFLNGVVVPESVYGSGAGTQQNTGQAILAIGANDKLTLVNHTSAAAVTLAAAPPIGGTVSAVNASILIQKLD